MTSNKIAEFNNQELSNVRILVDLKEYDIEKDTRLLIPFSYYQHYGLMNRDGESSYPGIKWGLIDSTGNFILEPNYKEIGVSNDKKILTLRHMDGQYEVITIDGEVVIPKGKYPWVDTCVMVSLVRIKNGALLT